MEANAADPSINIPPQASQVVGWCSGNKPISSKDVIAEAKLQLLLAGPIALVTLLLYGVQIVTVMFVGHLGVSALSGAALGYSFVSATGIIIVLGMCTALDTLCGQSYGAKHYRLVGIHMQRSVIVHLLTCIMLSALWANTGLILKAAGQNLEIADTAGVYARYLMPSVYGYAVLQSLVKFLQTQSLVYPMMLISAFTFVFHIFLCWVMIYKSSLGFRGAAMATSISIWLSVLIYSLYVKFSPSCKETWPGISKEPLKGIGFHLRLAIPSAFMLGVVDIRNYIASRRSSTKSKVTNISTFYHLQYIFSYCHGIIRIWGSYQVRYAVGQINNTSVSNELGAGNPQAAKLATYVVFSIYSVVGLVITLVLIATRRVIGYAYSKDREVVAAVATMMLILAASNLLDGTQCILSGIVRGCGKQKVGAFCNLAAFYLAGLPSAVILAFVLRTGAMGLWLGMLIAFFVQAVCLTVATICTYFEKEADKAKERMQKFNIHADGLESNNQAEDA